LLGNQCGEPLAMVRRLETAFSAATAGRHDEEAARAAIQLPNQFYRLGREEEARAWLEIARAALKRLNVPAGRLEAWLRLAESTADLGAGDAAAAVAASRDGLAIEERVLGLEHPDRVHGLASLGNALLEAGQVAEALAVCRDGVATCRRILGGDHPMCALVLFNLGEALEDSGAPSEAREQYSLSLSIWRRAGAAPTFLAWALTRIGRTLVEDNRAGEAVAPLEEALELRVTAQAPAAQLGETRFTLARALGSRAGARARAVSLARAARDDLAPDTKAVARIDAWLAGAGAKGARPPSRPSGAAPTRAPSAP
jgi:tetratricopeptide (TPR) repeat protein